jgi:DNA-binding transcriptional regulator LsrR (DeoR family)
MAEAKPTLGYATRTEAVEALVVAGWNNRQIAARLGIGTNTVAAFVVNMRRKRGRLSITIEGDMAEAIRDEAKKRDLPPHALVIECMAAILADDLFDAVLNDE